MNITNNDEQNLTHLKLLNGLNYESKGDNNGRKN